MVENVFSSGVFFAHSGYSRKYAFTAVDVLDGGLAEKEEHVLANVVRSDEIRFCKENTIAQLVNEARANKTVQSIQVDAFWGSAQHTRLSGRFNKFSIWSDGRVEWGTEELSSNICQLILSAAAAATAADSHIL